MSASLLLQEFQRLSKAPDAITKLRRFVLELAVRGKLVGQLSDEKPAWKLLERVRNPTWVIETTSAHLTVPRNWAIDELGNLASKITDGAHKTPTYVQSGIPFVSIKDFSQGTLDLRRTRLIPESEHRLLYKRCDPRRGDILIGRIGTLGKAIVVNTDEEFSLFVSVALIRCRPETLLPEFLKLQLNSPQVEGQFKQIKVGGATHTNKLNLADLNTVLIVVPPLAEQQRIIKKVQESMELCDELELAQRKSEARRDKLVMSTLHRLSNAANNTDRSAFEDSARFYFNHLPRLTVRPEHIQQLRQAILDVAVRGKLFSQDADKDAVSELLQKVDQERAIVAAADRRAEAQREAFLERATLWDVPDTWNWRALSDLVLFIDYRGKTPSKTDAGIRLVTAKNIRRGFIAKEPQEFVSETTYHAWMTRGFPKVGDVLFTTEAPMGNAAVVNSSEQFALAQRAICFRLYGGLNPEFFVMQLLSSQFQQALDTAATGLTAKGIKAAKLRRLPFAVPPLSEQLRIVSRVNELTELCDRLGTQLATNARIRGSFLEATIQKALESEQAQSQHTLRR